MDPDLMKIGDAATALGVSVDTLRRWDESGRFSSMRNAPAGYRYYSKKAVEIYLNDLLKLATDWIFSGEEIPAYFYCKDSSIFQARLSKMQDQLGAVDDEEVKKNFPLVVAVAGEIGDNSFSHNLGNWPDVPGIFFGYDINKKGRLCSLIAVKEFYKR